MSAFIDSLLDLLSPLGGVTARRMFGGYGIYKEGLMFGLVAGERFYLRTDELTNERFEDQGCEPFVFGIGKSGKPVVSKYFEPPEAAFANEQRMKTWARLAWECAQRSAVEKAAKQGARKSTRKAGAPSPSKKRPPRKKPSAD